MMPRHREQKGFTLIETMVALAILFGAIAGPLTITANAITAARSAGNQITANFLAQEAIELVRNRRDLNTLLSRAWLTGLNCSGNGCYVDVSNIQVRNCPAGGCPLIYFNETTGRYRQSMGVGWDETIFTRQVIVNEIQANREAEVVVTLSWQESGNPRSVVVQENIFNWQQ